SKTYDNELTEAIKKFQKDQKLTVNGNFDKETNNKFTEMLVNKANEKDTVLDELLDKLK
ncbi:peptidoglycan-binding protein, partial [Staphylococcus arlettae]